MKSLSYWRTGTVIAAVSALTSGLAGATDPLDTLGKSAAEWVQVRMEAARLETAWRSEQTLLASTVSALEERATLAEEERDLALAKTVREREELGTLEEKARSGDEDVRSLEARLQALSLQLAALRPQLPPRLSAALELSYRTLADPATPLGERLQTCMTVLNRCVQFNRLISAGEEALQLEPGGPTQSLEVIYWGLSHGYALDRPAGRAWLGTPGDHGWQWAPQPDAAPAVAQLLAIHHDKADPDFVLVPATLAGAEGGGR